MVLSNSYIGDLLSLTSRRLLNTILSPLCGLSQRISFMSRGRSDPAFAVAGCELTGVHLLRNPHFRGEGPSPFNYHIGGVGQLADEVYIRCLAETVERYSQLVAEASGRFAIRFASFEELVAESGCTILPADRMVYFTDAQFAKPGFPFGRFQSSAPMGWLKVDSLVDKRRLWVPAQLLLVGYEIRRASGEPWLWSAVTTGTATHSSAGRAFHSALLELIQIDCAVGHWYSDSPTWRVGMDDRTGAMDRLLKRKFRKARRQPEFYRLPIHGFSCHAVACLVFSDGAEPFVGIGLGCSRDLEEAMYRALLEAVAVLQLAKIVLLVDEATSSEKDGSGFWDFNRNIVHYAKAQNAGVIVRKFAGAETVDASDLPTFPALSIDAANRVLVSEFRALGMELVGMDISAPETLALGLRTCRVWSPGTLGLPPPSAPPVAHSRFEVFGGVTSEAPHPYP